MRFEVDAVSMLSGSLALGLVSDLAIGLAIDLTAWRERWHDRSQSPRR